MRGWWMQLPRKRQRKEQNKKYRGMATVGHIPRNKRIFIAESEKDISRKASTMKEELRQRDVPPS